MAFPDPKLGLVLNYGYPDTWGIILAGFLPSQDLRPLGLCRSVSLHFSKLSAINAIELAIGKPACPASQRRTYSVRQVRDGHIAALTCRLKPMPY